MGTSAEPSQISLALERVVRGDPQAADALLPLVYSELRLLAERRLKKLPPGQTLQPTALVHDAYLELVGKGDPGWNGRGHFFGAAARAMHDLLVDQARRKSAQKRGGDLDRQTLDDSRVARAVTTEPEDVITLSRALDALRSAHPRQAEIAMLKTFAGLEEAEIAEMHGVSARTVERDWRFAQAFLRREMAR